MRSKMTTTMNLFEKYHATMAPDGPAGGGSNPPGPSSSPSAAPSGPSDSGSGSSNSAPSSSPTSSPSPPSSPSPSSTPGGAGEAFDFGSMFEGPTDSVAALAATAAPPVTGPEPAQPPPPTEVPPAAPAAAVEAPPKDARVEPAAAPDAAKVASDQSTTPQAAKLPAFDEYDPINLSQHLAQNEAAAQKFIAEQMFQLTPQEKESLEQDVIGTIPQLLAKVFVRSQYNVLQQMGKMIPVMMQRHLEATKRNSAGEDKFFKRWNGLDPEKHGDTARKYAAVYRQMHPQASLDQMIEDLGPMVMMAHKVAPTLPTAKPGPAANPVSQAANGRSPPPSPFVPAGAGPTSAPRTPDLEAWEAMFQQKE